MRMDASFLWRVFIIGVLSALFVTDVQADVQADVQEMFLKYEEEAVSATFVGVSQFAALGDEPLKNAAQMKGQKLPTIQWGANKAWRLSSGGTISLHQAKKIRPSFAYMAQEPRRLFVKYSRGAVAALSVMHHDAGFFEIGVLGRDFCVNGDMIQGAGLCSAAAATLGIAYHGTVNQSNLQRGCICNAKKEKIYFNRAASGRLNPDRAPVCNLRAFDQQVNVGKSGANRKIVYVGDETWLDCPLEWKQGGATFTIHSGVPFVSGAINSLIKTGVIVTRKDRSTGWNFDVKLTCKRTPDSSPSAWIDRTLNKYVHAMDGFVKCQQGVAKVGGIAGKIGLAGATFDEIRRLMIWIFEELTDLMNRITKPPVSGVIRAIPVKGKFISMGAKLLKKGLDATKPLRETLFATWGKFKMLLLQFNTMMAGIDVSGSATAAYVVGSHRALLHAKRCADRNANAWKVGQGGWELEQAARDGYLGVARDMNRIHDIGITCGIVFEPMYIMLDAVNDFLKPIAKLREPISEFAAAARGLVKEINKAIDAVMENDAFQCGAAIFKPFTALGNLATCPVDELIGLGFKIAQDLFIKNLDKLLKNAMDLVLESVVDVIVPDDFHISMPAFDEQGTLMDPRWLDERFGDCTLDSFTGVFFPHFTDMINNIMQTLPMELDGKTLERLILDELLFNAGDEYDFSVNFDDYDSACVEAWNDLIEVPDFAPCERVLIAIGCTVAGATIDVYNGVLDVAIAAHSVALDLFAVKRAALDAARVVGSVLPWMKFIIEQLESAVRSLEDALEAAQKDVDRHKQEVNELRALQEWTCGDKKGTPPVDAIRALGFAFPPKPYNKMTPEAVVPDSFQVIGKGYCKDWIYPSTGTQVGVYDDLSSTAQGCMERCSALNPGYRSFYLKGTQCGCSRTTQGRCAVQGHSAYTAYVFNPRTFKKIGNGYCKDWIFPSTGTQVGEYDNLSSTAQGCMERCLALNPAYTSFYLKGTKCGCSTATIKNGKCAVQSHSSYTAYALNPSLGGPNVSNPRNLKACIGECDKDSECANGLKCFQRTGFTPIPGCNGLGKKDWDYCYDPLGSIELSGPDDNTAKGLLACTGECDYDEDCAFGLKCFQRAKGETIPGCKGSGNGQDWDYCYDPSWTAGTELARGKPTAQSSTGWGGSSSRAVDGNTNGQWGARSTTHTYCDAKEWWRVDLQVTADIYSVHIWNRMDCCGNRIEGATIKVGATDNVDSATPCAVIDSISGSKGFNCAATGRTGRFVFVQNAPNRCLSLAEVKVFGKVRTDTPMDVEFRAFGNGGQYCEHGEIYRGQQNPTQCKEACAANSRCQYYVTYAHSHCDRCIHYTHCNNLLSTTCGGTVRAYIKVDSFTNTIRKIGDGYCKDWIFPNGKRSGGYDNVSSTAHGCMRRCSALNPGYSSFYLKGTKCGCSTKKTGACALQSHSSYTAYVFNPRVVHALAR